MQNTTRPSEEKIREQVIEAMDITIPLVIDMLGDITEILNGLEQLRNAQAAEVLLLRAQIASQTEIPNKQ